MRKLGQKQAVKKKKKKLLMCLSSLFPPGRPPEVGGRHSVSDGEKRGCCQPQLSPDISSLLLKSHLAARPLPLVSPELFWGGIYSTDALMAMIPGTSASSLGLIRCAARLRSIRVAAVPISLHYPQTGVCNQQLTCWCPQLLG